MKRRAREYIIVAPLLMAALAAIAAGVMRTEQSGPAESARQAHVTRGPLAEGQVIRLADLQDPWGRAYYYRCPGVHDPEGYDLWSAGPDGVSGTRDDITNWISE